MKQGKHLPLAPDVYASVCQMGRDQGLVEGISEGVVYGWTRSKQIRILLTSPGFLGVTTHAFWVLLDSQTETM